MRAGISPGMHTGPMPGWGEAMRTLSLGAGGGFNPRTALWPTGTEAGLWLDQSDSATVFQESTGTTAGAVNSPTGLRLDKRLGATRSTVFSDSTGSTSGWTGANANLSTVDGRLQLVTTAGFGNASRSFATVIGQRYFVSVNASASAGSTYFRCGTAANGSQNFNVVIPAGGGSDAQSFAATATTTYLTVGSGASSTETISFDDFLITTVPGNHVLQATSAARPTWNARVNLLTKTEQFDDAAWAKTNCTVTANAVTAPDGTLTADKLVENADVGLGHYVQQAGSALQAGSGFTGKIYLKEGERRYGYIYVTTLGEEYAIAVDLQTGTITDSLVVSAPINPVSSVDSVGGGWYRVSIGFQNEDAGQGATLRFGPLDVSTLNAIIPTYNGNGSSGIYIWGADLRTDNDAALNIPAYQRVNTASDYDTAGFPLYDGMDGVDDGYSTAAFAAGTLTSNMDCFIAVKRNSAAQFIMAHEPGAAASFFAAVNSASGASPHLASGTPTYLVNGTSAGTTRQDLHNALTVGSWVVLEVRNLDLSGAAWDGFALSLWTGEQLPGNIGGVILCPAQSDEMRAQIRTYLGNKVGLSL